VRLLQRDSHHKGIIEKEPGIEVKAAVWKTDTRPVTTGKEISTLDIGIQPDSNRLTVNFGRGNGIPMRTCDDEGFAGRGRGWFFQINFDEQFVVPDFNFQRHIRSPTWIVSSHLTGKAGMCQ
jgi:hypothetical protein